MLNGENPFKQLPCYYAVNEMWQGGLDPQLYENLNSPKYYSVYPPLSQMVFVLGALVGSNSALSSIVVMKSILLLAYSGSLFVVRKILLEQGRSETKADLVGFYATTHY